MSMKAFAGVISSCLCATLRRRSVLTEARQQIVVDFVQGVVLAQRLHGR